MMHIPNSLALTDLTEIERRVLAYGYARAKECQKPRHMRNHSGGVFFFFAATPGQVAEKRLFELGLFARARPGGAYVQVEYGYAISYDGYEWYEAQVAAPASTGTGERLAGE